MAALLYNRNHSNHPIVLHRENSTQANNFFKSKVASTMFYEIWRDDCARGNIGGWFITTHTREGHECLNQIFSNCPIDQPTDWHCFSATSGKNRSEVSVIRWEYFERKKTISTLCCNKQMRAVRLFYWWNLYEVTGFTNKPHILLSGPIKPFLWCMSQ